MGQAPHDPDDDELPRRRAEDRYHHEERLALLERQAELHTEQVAELVVTLRNIGQKLPQAISQEVGRVISAYSTDEAVDKMVGIALDRLRIRAVKSANATAWALFKDTLSKLLKIAGVLWLAWLVGGTHALADVWRALFK